MASVASIIGLRTTWSSGGAFPWDGGPRRAKRHRPSSIWNLDRFTRFAALAPCPPLAGFLSGHGSFANAVGPRIRLADAPRSGVDIHTLYCKCRPNRQRNLASLPN
ncbi:hypothetical protein F4823DRAFT_594522 [Ustulina deusta]|nr:hypothetical protein F4823DRAFT_594522 [Ustulina deusta]